MSDKRVFLGGEGKNELGGWAAERPYRTAEAGVIEALLKKAAPEGWSVCDARTWKSYRAFRAGRHDHRDTHIVLGLALDAREAKADVLAFTRDLDNDRDRERAVDEAIEQLRTQAHPVRLVGGVAKPCIEGWVLAAKGVRGTDGFSRNRCSTELGEPDTAGMVAVVEGSSLPADSGAESLNRWMASARAALNQP